MKYKDCIICTKYTVIPTISVISYKADNNTRSVSNTLHKESFGCNPETVTYLSSGNPFWARKIAAGKEWPLHRKTCIVLSLQNSEN